MLQTTLLKNIMSTTQELHVRETEEQEIISFFKRYEKNTSLKYVYAGALYKHLNYDIKLTYEFLEHLTNLKSLKRLFEFRCPHSSFRKIFYCDYTSLPDTVFCDECEEEFTTRDYIYVIYEVNF